MTDRVGGLINQDNVKEVLGLAVVGTAAALTAGAAAIPAAVARGWVAKRAIDGGAGLLTRTLVK
jgi:hypothetical protein